jgi:hypothetical protein
MPSLLMVLTIYQRLKIKLTRCKLKFLIRAGIHPARLDDFLIYEKIGENDRRGNVT